MDSRKSPKAVARAKLFLLSLVYLGATLFYLGAVIAIVYFFKFLGLVIVMSTVMVIVAITLLILIFGSWETQDENDRLIVFVQRRDLENAEQSWILQDEGEAAHNDKPEPSELN